MQEKNDHGLSLEKEKALLIEAAKQFQSTVGYNCSLIIITKSILYKKESIIITKSILKMKICEY
jgi:hypothetical protein